ncbi:hypothetical protein FACS189441_4300 [Betaproteobacteria bacterium]|nr:hypothetical protein FACS189441_4300 [Betaproteobacteria bacterium]
MALQEEFEQQGNWLFRYRGILPIIILFVGTATYTPANTSGRNTTGGQLADCLNTTGIYSIVRHPLYLGNFLMWFGISLLTGNLWFVTAFCLIYCVYYERIMYAEEQFFRRKFGIVYTEWAAKTPVFSFYYVCNQFDFLLYLEILKKENKRFK